MTTARELGWDPCPLCRQDPCPKWCSNKDKRDAERNPPAQGELDL